MITIDGLDLPEKYLPDFEWVRDIQYYDGPLLSEFISKSGELYTFHWCDCSEEHQRWLVLRVTKRSLLELTSGLISIYNFMTNRPLSSSPILLDYNDDGCVVGSKMINIGDLPESYLPSKEAMIMPELFEESEKKIYPLLIDGDWKSEELSIIPRRFMDLYALIFQFIKKSKSTEAKLMDVPWKGGYSSVNFYSTLKANLSQNVELKSIQYASPGYIEFYADRDISLLLKKNVDIYINSKEEIDTVYRNLSLYIQVEKFNKMNVVKLTASQDVMLNRLAESLLSKFSEPSWEWILNTSSDTFKSTQTARSFYRKVKEVSNFVLEERLLFANI